MKTNTDNTKKKAIDIESLLAKRNSISNTALKGALEKLEKQKEEQQEAELLQHLSRVQENTAQAVELLREARVKEKNRKAYLVTIAEAESEFYTDADIAKYNLTIAAARSQLQLH